VQPKPAAPVSPPAGSSTAPASSLTKPNPPAAAPPKPVEPPVTAAAIPAPAATPDAAPNHATTTAAATTPAHCPNCELKVQQVSGSTTAPATTSEEPGFFSRIFGGSDEIGTQESGPQDPSRRDMRKTLRDQKKNARLGIPQSHPSSSDRVAARTNSAGQPLTPSKTQLGQQAAAKASPSHAGSKPSSAAPAVIAPRTSELDSLTLPFADDAPLPAHDAPATSSPGLIPSNAPAGEALEGVAAPEIPAASPAPPVEAALDSAAAPAAAAPAPVPAEEEVWNPFADSAAIPSASPAPLAEESSEFFTPAEAQPQEPAAFPAGDGAQAPAPEPLPLANAAAIESALPAANEPPAADPFENPFTGLKLEPSPYTTQPSAAPAQLNKLAPAPVPAPTQPAAKPALPVTPAAPFIPPEPESFETSGVEAPGNGVELAANGSPLWAPGGADDPSFTIETDSTLIGPSIIPGTMPDPIQAPRSARQLDASQESHEADTQSKLARLKERQQRLGLKGFCLVSLTDHRDLVDARPEYSTVYRGQKYYFCPEEALAEFEAAPAMYAPAAGGNDVVHLAFTGEASLGSLDYAVWYKGKLYMFGSAETMETFVAAPSSHAQE
jgi:YHS domain-containing protein